MSFVCGSAVARNSPAPWSKPRERYACSSLLALTQLWLKASPCVQVLGLQNAGFLEICSEADLPVQCHDLVQALSNEMAAAPAQQQNWLSLTCFQSVTLPSSARAMMLIDGDVVSVSSEHLPRLRALEVEAEHVTSVHG